MYDLPQYKTSNQQVIGIMKTYPFVMLTGVDRNRSPVVSHIPVLIEERGDELCLVGHIMKSTDHYEAFLQNDQALVVFSGPHAYISASWYVNPKQASTWNYITVHAGGTLTFLDDDRLLEVLQKTTAHFEQDPGSPAAFEALDPTYINRLLKAIVAFEIKVKTLKHVFKLSQNRDEKSFKQIVDKLMEGDENERAVASLMVEYAGQKASLSPV
ncbi:FMN-binding negative transcriptional regulator [Segetibacter sp. 3557_3]|uniref:FMN-binding negative transcriptional regulator n=1 Tax=Segetibacter sp. 3557_3 TaxID=2547429 RepID=UPI001058C844|nr:FMN-binding negative transcriptional regulator [Segetibacter sp. 3557_3]TDH25585.1 FMN-binding negative transcriptional regulator [Segetibacter sp. 3557_3]